MAFDREKALNSAQKHLSKGHLDKALAEYRKITKEDAQDARAWLKIGDLLARKGEAENACDAYERVAGIYADGGFFLKAVAVYKQVAKLQPSRFRALERLAEMYQSLDLMSDAIAAYQRLGEVAIREGQLNEAERALRRVCDLAPSNLTARVRLAECLSKLEQPEAAADAFETAAGQLLAQDRLEDYAKVAERLLFHSPQRIHIARQLAEVYLKVEQPKRALAKLQIAFRVNPREPATLRLLSVAFERLDQVAKAVSVLRELARIYGDNGQSIERRQCLEAILRLDPSDQEAVAALNPAAAAPVPAPLPAQSAAPVDDSAEVLDNDDLEVIEDDDALEEVGAAPSTDVSAPPPMPSAASQQPASPEAEQAARLYAECEVFLRYGLKKKARGHLEALLRLQPTHIQAREHLKDLLLEEGAVTDARFHLSELANLLAEHDPSLAQTYREQAASIEDPPASSIPAAADIDGSADMPELPDTVEAAVPEEDTTDIEEVLDEADFFLAQGLFDAAHASINEVLVRHPTHPLLLEKLEEIREGMLASAISEEESVADFDPSKSISKSVKLPDASDATLDDADPLTDLDANVVELETGIQIDDIDAMLDNLEGDGGENAGASETHFDLGIAYKEMGLFDQAVHEFEQSIAEQQRVCSSCMMIALCLREEGRFDESVEQFQRGLRTLARSRDETLALYYELADTFLLLGRAPEAETCFVKITELDPQYRDVAQRLRQLA